MSQLLGADAALLVWGNGVIAVAGLCVAIMALLQTRRSNATAREANSISRGANDSATEANQLAAKALKMQEDEGRVRLVVKPRMLCVIGNGEDSRPRPSVEVINLSAFPVTITNIHWKTSSDEKAWFYWKNPTITSPFEELPARLPAREALTALGTPTSFRSLDDLRTVTAAVVFTASGEQIEGMTQQWQDEVARMVKDQTAG
jgi:hypothetical protein